MHRASFQLQNIFPYSHDHWLWILSHSSCHSWTAVQDKLEYGLSHTASLCSYLIFCLWMFSNCQWTSMGVMEEFNEHICLYSFSYRALFFSDCCSTAVCKKKKKYVLLAGRFSLCYHTTIMGQYMKIKNK